MNWLSTKNLSSKELKETAIIAASQFADFHRASAELAVNSLPDNVTSDIHSLIRLARYGRWMDGAIKEIESKLPTGSIEERYLLVSTIPNQKRFEKKLFQRCTSEHWEEEYTFRYMVTGNFRVIEKPNGSIGGDFKFIFRSSGIFASFPIQIEIVEYKLGEDSEYSYPRLCKMIEWQEDWQALDLAGLAAGILF